MNKLWNILWFGLIATNIQAQTCCSGGVPLSGNLGLPSSEEKTWQFTLSYDWNVLKTLKDSTIVLNDNARNRTTHSALFEIGYTLNKRFSIDGFFSYVRQERTINQFGNTDFVFTNGIGDAILLFKYQVFSKQTIGKYKSWQVGIGPKIPLGSSTKRNQNGILLNADLQPGSGAWDGVLWSNYSQQLGIRPSMTFTSTFTYSFKGKNNNYLGSLVYQFGNEFQGIMGISDRFLIKNTLIDPSIALRYRGVTADKNSGEVLPNTGGKFLFLVPRISWIINAKINYHLSTELPLYANVVGTQLSPTFRINTGFYYKFQQKQKLHIETK